MVLQNPPIIYTHPVCLYCWQQYKVSNYNTNPMIMQILFSLNVKSQNFVLTYLRSMQLLLR